jgi:tetratricopeptide (TPR) repeat protein
MDTHDAVPAGDVAVAPARPKLRDAWGRPYEPAVGPRLKILLFVIFVGVALLGATGAYLAAISWLNWYDAPRMYTNQFSLWMFAAHAVFGILLVIPFLVFGFLHLSSARHRKNRVAVRLGIALFTSGIVVCFTGLALNQFGDALPKLPTGSLSRQVTYWLHVGAPVLAVVLYVLHRRAGPDIQWRWGGAWGIVVGLFVVVMVGMHKQDPRQWHAKGSPEGEKYYEPSKARTVDGNFIPATALLMDEYCLKCHPDIYNSHIHSVHKFSSFNNPPYRFSVQETRRVAMDRDGNTRASRWCAGCHDPVPLFSGEFDDPLFQDPKYDLSKHPTANAGITCTVCHAMTNINSPIGNADYTIEEPLHYPFAYSDNPALQWFNQQLVKAKPEFHKRTFLKDFHRTERFCSTCHKVSIPMEVNHYKEFLRGQNHPDAFLLSGVSGRGARSFYYPEVAKTRCSDCHMPLIESKDFGNQLFDDSGIRKVHSHFQIGANTGLAALVDNPQAIEAHTKFLQDKKVRIDLFGLRRGDSIDGELIAPLRPQLPPLEPGQTYLVEVVVRTLNIGHPLTQGTADSNELWVDFTATAKEKTGDRIIGRSGALDGPDEQGRVDEWAHFINMLLLDRDGNRIDRRNPQDIFTPLYDHQIPPGAANSLHYKLQVPNDVQGPIELTVRVRYRKFDHKYMELVYGKGKVPKLPIVEMCQDRVLLPVAGVADPVPTQTSPIDPAWQRWNDYGIGLFLIGDGDPEKRGMLQAREAFQRLLSPEYKAGHGQAHLNLARVYNAVGRLDEARQALRQALQSDPPAPPWTVAWLTGVVLAQSGQDLDQAITQLEWALAYKDPARKFDFSKDWFVINELGKTLFRRAQQEGPRNRPERDRFLVRAVEQFERTLQIEPEDLDAHSFLRQCFERLVEDLPATFTPTDQVVLANATASMIGGSVPIVLLPAALPVDPTRLQELGQTLADEQQPLPPRLEAATELARALRQYGSQPPQVTRPKLPVLQALRQKVRPLFAAERDPSLRSAAAHVLAELHLQMHSIFKPDDIAKDRTVRLYRQSHPAADHASHPIVIYSLNQAGAPGAPAAQ